MMHRLYDTARWDETAARVRRRDGNSCILARLLGGCSASLHIHHIVPVEDGGPDYDDDNLVTVCSRHHPMLEAFRRQFTRTADRPRCGHYHRTAEAREDCERRLARNASVTETHAVA